MLLFRTLIAATSAALIFVSSAAIAKPDEAPPTVNVNVTNEPLATQSSKVPVQRFLSFVMQTGDVAGKESEPYEVPEGMRLVIEYIDVHTSVSSCQYDLFARVSTYADGVLQGIWAPVAPSYQGSGGFYRNHASAPFKMYADPGSPVTLLLNRNNTSCSAIGSVVFSGYLEADL